MDEPLWLRKARAYIGTAEIKGPKHNGKIIGWWKALKAAFRDDETPWCGAFVGGVIAESGIPTGKGSASARSWLGFGRVINRPALGCVVVFWRGSKTGWSGHVGFIVGKDQKGNIMVLGGNQGDAVNIKPFSTDRVLGYRWPGLTPHLSRYDLPLLKSDGTLSTNEA